MAEGYTDEVGIAVFIAEEGKYSVSASKPGLTMQIVEVTINRDVTVEITLQPITRETLIPTITFTAIGLVMLSFL